MEAKRGFASDNNAAVHPDVLAAIQASNQGHVIGYGDDPYSTQAVADIKTHFGEDTDVHFVFNGTAANVIGLKSMTDTFNSIICTDVAHIEEDECGAPEMFTGCKLLPVSSVEGKLSPEMMMHHLKGFDFEHHSQPKVVSITQATEMGTVYTPDEISAISSVAHKYGLLVHMDGARISNAASHLKLSLREISRDTGVDVLSFGATKNGGMYGEAILFFRGVKNKFFKYYRKQGMQLASKMRYIAVQFSALLNDELWLRNASHANYMATLLNNRMASIPQIEITQPVQTNGVFARVPTHIIPKLQSEFFFYVWDEHDSVVRWMTSWDTTEEDIDQFEQLICELL